MSYEKPRCPPLPPGPAAIVNGIDLRQHTGLVHRVTQPRWRKWGCRPRAGLEYADLVSAGLEGLIVAAERFQAERGFAFSTYATWWVRHRVGRTIDEQSRSVRVPVYKLQEMRKAGEAPPVAFSLDRPIGDQDGRTHGDMLPDTTAVEPIDAIIREQDADDVRAAMAELPERYRLVLQMRYWRGKMLKDVGDALGGLSRERARQLETEALEFLRAHLSGDRIAAMKILRRWRECAGRKPRTRAA